MTAELAIRDEQHYLATVSDVRALCERIDTVGDAKSLADRARAAQVWAERARLGQAQVNLAAMARLWAERRAGELLMDIRGTAGRLPNGTIANHNISLDESHRFQKLAEIPESDFGDALEIAAENGRVTAMSVHYSSATSEWSTPQDFFDLVASEFPFELDVCAASENAKCPAFYAMAEDGLAQPWTGVCWMNPPYGRVIKDWITKAWASAKDGATVACLLPARTDTSWWWDYCRHAEVRFLRGRLSFGGRSELGAPFPSVLVIFGRPAATVYWEAWR